ncbi:MAG: hypothetical protein HYT13_00155 [Candidatus Liptonbacteria bacterium]|nr:hypothetical protein [Candidatus Liptonbacteria bacterium]
MDYSLITERELFKRFNSLPQSIQNMLEREANHQIIERVCQNHRLIDEERVLMVKQLTGLVLFGFIHTEDLGREINEALELNNPRLAASIADEINRKIFSSIRDDLERNFTPLPEPEIESGPAPRILSEIKKPLETFGSPPKMIEEIKQPQAPPPAPTGQAIPSPTSPPREPSETFKEEPIILHEEAESEPGKPASGFKLEAPLPKFEEVGEKFTPPMRPARLEIGGETNLRTPLMSPEQELPSPPQPVKEVNIRAEEIKINMTPMPIQKKRRGFWGWLKSLFSRKSQKEIIFAPKVISEEELKREALTIKASMPKPPSPPPRPSEPFRAPAPQPSPAPPDDSNTVDLKNNHNAG